MPICQTKHILYSQSGGTYRHQSIRSTDGIFIFYLYASLSAKTYRLMRSKGAWYEGRDERRRDGLEITPEFSDGNIATQVSLVNALERTEEVTDIGPQALSRIDVNLADTIAIIISGPLILPVSDRGMSAEEVVVGLVFIGVDRGLSLGELMDVSLKGLGSGVLDDPDTHLPTLSTDSTNNGGTVIVIGTLAPPLVGPTTRGVVRVQMLDPFFPPHSETSHRFQSVGQGAGFLVGLLEHWLAVRAAVAEPSCNPVQALLPAPWSALLYTPLSGTTPLSTGADAFLGRLFPYTGCRVGHTLGSGRLSVHSVWSAEIRVPGSSLLHSGGSSSPLRESGSISRLRFLRTLVTLGSEIPSFPPLLVLVRLFYHTLAPFIPMSLRCCSLAATLYDPL